MSLRRLVPVLLMLIGSAAFSACDSKKSEFFEPIAGDGAGLLSDEATGGVSGLVTVDGLPLAGVRIALGPPASRDGTTDGDGRFLFEALDPGSYPVELSDLPAGVACPEIAVSVVVVAGEVVSVDFGCAAIGGVQGMVILNGGGYEGVRVTVAGPDTLRTDTGPDGSFGFADLPVGPYTVSLDSLPSEVVCAEYSFDRTVERAGMTSATFDCTDLGAVSGTVVLDGAPYAGAQDTTLDLSGLDLAVGSHYLVAEVVDNTPWVRDPDVREGFLTGSREWDITVPEASSTGNAVAAVGLQAGNFPNPFNPQTTIRFNLPRPERVEVRIFDMNGALVRALPMTATLQPGWHEIPWDGRDDRGRQVVSGNYFYRLAAGTLMVTEKMALLR